MSSVLTVVAGANAGTGPPAPVLLTNSTDERGIITFGTGTTPSAGILVVVTFASNLSGFDDESGVAGFIQFSPQNAVTAAILPAIVPNGNKLGWTINSSNAPAASQGSGIYAIAYNVVL